MTVSQSTPKVLIVGGGIAGLSTAAFLRDRSDLIVQVLERNAVAATTMEPTDAQESDSMGDYGIAIASNGSACLAQLGMRNHAIELNGSELEQILMRPSDSVTEGGGVTFPGAAAFGYPTVFCRRSRLLRWLTQRCVEQRADLRPPVEIVEHSRVTTIDAVQGVVQDDRGRTFIGDVLVCADGIAKTGRAAVIAAQRRSSAGQRPTNDDDEDDADEEVIMCAYMSIVPPAAILARSSLRSLLDEPVSAVHRRSPPEHAGNSTLANWYFGTPRPDLPRDEAQRAWQTQRRVVLYPVDRSGNHQLFAYFPVTDEVLTRFGRKARRTLAPAQHDQSIDDHAIATTSAATAVTRGSVLRGVDAQHAAKAFSAFHKDVKSLLTLKPTIDLSLVRDSDPIPSWSAAGRTVLVGDAAHASIPLTGQGSAQALEDAEALSYCLAAQFHHAAVDAQPSTASAVASAIASYEHVRVARAHMVQNIARLTNGYRAGLEELDVDAATRDMLTWAPAKAFLGAPKEV